MKSSQKNSRWAASALVAVLLVAVSCLLVVGEGKAAPPQSKSTKKRATSATRAAKSGKSAKRSKKSGTKSKVRTARSRRGLPHSSRGRLALLHLDPSRVEEIQQALIREGSLNGPPTGTWDDTTKNAMRHYQSENGFAETGLPDAKSLMKLGLGPHPLPDDVAAAAATNSDGQSKIDALEHPNN